MTSREKILFSLKQNKDLRKEVLLFAKGLTNLPDELIETAFVEYLNNVRDEILNDPRNSKRSLTSLRLLWDAEIIHREVVRADIHKQIEETKKAELEKKTLLAKNVKPCPSCKLNDTYLHEKFENNGIIGPGSRSWVVESYWICNKCGVHFSPKN